MGWQITKYTCDDSAHPSFQISLVEFCRHDCKCNLCTKTLAVDIESIVVISMWSFDRYIVLYYVMVFLCSVKQWMIKLNTISLPLLFTYISVLKSLWLIYLYQMLLILFWWKIVKNLENEGKNVIILCIINWNNVRSGASDQLI